MLIFSRYCIKVVKFVAFRGKTQELVLVSQFSEFCESRDGRKKFPALIIVPVCLSGNIFQRLMLITATDS